MIGSSDKSRALYTMVVLELLLLVSFWAAQRSLFPFLATDRFGVPLWLEQMLDSLYKCVRGSLSKIKSKEIIRLRITQGIEEMCAASNEEQNMVIRKWHELQQDGLTQEGH
jgi:hypothetical protein